MFRSSWCALPGALSLSILLLVGPGCGSFENREAAGPTPEQQKIENLTQSVELLRDTLRITAEERDGFKQSYQGSTTELRARAADTEYLEARVRVHRAELQELTKQLGERDQRVRTLDGELAASRVLITAEKTESERLRALNDRLSAECSRLEVIVATEATAREALTAQVAEAEARAKNGQRAVSEQVAELQKTLDLSRQETHELKAQVAQLKADLVAAESQLRAAVAPGRVRAANDNVAVVAPAVAPTTAPPLPTTPAATAVGSVPVIADTPPSPKSQATSAKAFLVAWATRSWSDVRAGRWNESSILFAGVAAGAGVFVLLFGWLLVRGRRARKPARDALRRVEQEPSMVRAPVAAPGMRTQPALQVTAAPAMAGAHRGYNAYMAAEPTIEMPSVVPPAPAFLPPEAPTQQFRFPNPDASAPTSELSDADFDPCVTQRIDVALDEAEIESASQRGRRALGATRGAPPTSGGVNEEALLADLKSVISEKFTELKHKKK
ncbi:MAG: hypothetical protein AB7O52_02595 [Planctomycetota bacterium]